MELEQINQSVTKSQQKTHLSQVFKAAPDQRMRASFIYHLHRVLNQTQQFYSHLVDVNDPTEDAVHILQEGDQSP